MDVSAFRPTRIDELARPRPVKKPRPHEHHGAMFGAEAERAQKRRKRREEKALAHDEERSGQQAALVHTGRKSKAPQRQTARFHGGVVPAAFARWRFVVERVGRRVFRVYKRLLAGDPGSRDVANGRFAGFVPAHRMSKEERPGALVDSPRTHSDEKLQAEFRRQDTRNKGRLVKQESRALHLRAGSKVAR